MQLLLFSARFVVWTVMSKWSFQKIWNNFYRWMNSLCVAKVIHVSMQTMGKLGLNIQGTFVLLLWRCIFGFWQPPSQINAKGFWRFYETWLFKRPSKEYGNMSCFWMQMSKKYSIKTHCFFVNLWLQHELILAKWVIKINLLKSFNIYIYILSKFICLTHLASIALFYIYR